MDDTKFHLLLKFLRERSGVSARQLSMDAGLSASYVSKVESGEVVPSVLQFARLIRQLDASAFEISYLLTALCEAQ